MGSGAGHARGAAVEPQVMRAPEVVSDWPVDVAEGRMRRWLRRESVPAPVEWERMPVEPDVYFPPVEWERPGTSSRPRVASSEPGEVTR
jgi:hypothetical protein